MIENESVESLSRGQLHNLKSPLNTKECSNKQHFRDCDRIHLKY